MALLYDLREGCSVHLNIDIIALESFREPWSPGGRKLAIVALGSPGRLYLALAELILQNHVCN